MSGAASNLLAQHERAARALLAALDRQAAADFAAEPDRREQEAADLAVDAAAAALRDVLDPPWTCTACGAVERHARGWNPRACRACGGAIERGRK